MDNDSPEKESSDRPLLHQHVDDGRCEFLAVPDCLESNRTSISKAGADSGPLAYLTNTDKSKAEISLPPKDSLPTSSDLEAKLVISEVKDEKDKWSLQETGHELSTYTAKRKGRSFEILNSDQTYELKFKKGENVTYTLTKTAPGPPEDICTITTESSHAWSYRMSCKPHPGFDLMFYSLPLFCLWLVTTVRVASNRLNDLVRRRSPRALFDLVFREKNYMEVATVS